MVTIKRQSNDLKVCCSENHLVWYKNYLIFVDIHKFNFSKLLIIFYRPSVRLLVLHTICVSLLITRNLWRRNSQQLDVFADRLLTELLRCLSLCLHDTTTRLCMIVDQGWSLHAHLVLIPCLVSLNCLIKLVLDEILDSLTLLRRCSPHRLFNDRLFFN